MYSMKKCLRKGSEPRGLLRTSYFPFPSFPLLLHSFVQRDFFHTGKWTSACASTLYLFARLVQQRDVLISGVARICRSRSVRKKMRRAYIRPSLQMYQSSRLCAESFWGECDARVGQLYFSCESHVMFRIQKVRLIENFSNCIIHKEKSFKLTKNQCK